MTKEEIERIKKHIEIHARQERGAVIITRVLRKAVDELEHIADLEKENELLKADFEFNAKQSTKKSQTVKKYQELVDEYSLEGVDLQDRIKELEKENAELRESVTKFSKDGLDFLHSIKSNRNCIDCESKMSIQLSNAKEIIKRFSEFVNNEIEYDPEHPQEHTDLWNKLCEEAEQFISEVEK